MTSTNDGSPNACGASSEKRASASGVGKGTDDPVPPAPYGLSYADEARVPLWWSMSGFIAWPLLPMTFDIATRYGLWDGAFKDFDVLTNVVELGEASRMTSTLASS